MKLIVAYIRPEKLNDVLEGLYLEGVRGLTMTRVQGHGGETSLRQTYRGMTVEVEMSDKIRLEVGVSEPFVDRTVNVILRTARTGEVGDGKVFVLPVDAVYRIRTGEEGESAVTPIR